MVGGPVGAAAGGVAGHLAPMVGQAVVGRTVMSPIMQQYLMNQYGAALRDLPRGRLRNVAPGVMVQSNDYPTR